MTRTPPEDTVSTESTVLHRFSIKPGHLTQYLPLWAEEVTVRRRHGFTVHRAFLETHAEPKLTMLYSHPDPPAGQAAVDADPRTAELTAAGAPHVFRNTLARPVDVEVLTPGRTDRLVVMRRYSIVGDWEEFLCIWRQIVPVRQTYGFRCLFAVADRPANMFTWAFDADCGWEDFPAAQKPYYRDPARVLLRGVFDYMADYAITPAEELTLPAVGAPPENT